MYSVVCVACPESHAFPVPVFGCTGSHPRLSTVIELCQELYKMSNGTIWNMTKLKDKGSFLVHKITLLLQLLRWYGYSYNDDDSVDDKEAKGKIIMPLITIQRSYNKRLKRCLLPIVFFQPLEDLIIPSYLPWSHYRDGSISNRGEREASLVPGLINIRCIWGRSNRTRKTC